MEISSVSQICCHLISTAIQRCRLSERVCLLSVLLKCSSASSVTSSVRISVSDTGAGSSLQEFKDLKYSISAETWDGVLSITTTSISENDVSKYQLDMKENILSRRLTKQPSTPKNGANFSGTEVILISSGSINDLLLEITKFLRKVLILKIPMVAMELAVKYGGTIAQQCEYVIAAKCCDLPSFASNIERLKLGFEDYVTKHGNSLDKNCPSCFKSLEHLKVGSGTALTAESQRSAGHVMDVVIIICQSSEPSNVCIQAFGPKTEVLCFKDFSPCSVTHSSLIALNSIDWRSYGLSLKNVIDQYGTAIMEWENLPPYAHIDIVLHCYEREVRVPPLKQKAQLERNLMKKAVKDALDDVKLKYAGLLLSARAVKICGYAPDLAKTIAGLILSSSDSNFQGECFTLLGLQPQDIGEEHVTECIKKKIVTVIETNDRKPQRMPVAPYIFQDDCVLESYAQEEEEEEYEEDTIQRPTH